MTGGEQLLILVVVLGVFWFLMMRPARNQRRQMQELQKNLSVGDEVVISAGIFGTVRAVEEGKVDLEIAPGTVVTVASQVVVRRAEESESDGTAEDAEDTTAPEDIRNDDGVTTATPESPATDEGN